MKKVIETAVKVLVSVVLVGSLAVVQVALTPALQNGWVLAGAIILAACMFYVLLDLWK